MPFASVFGPAASWWVWHSLACGFEQISPDLARSEGTVVTAVIPSTGECLHSPRRKRTILDNGAANRTTELVPLERRDLS